MLYSNYTSIKKKRKKEKRFIFGKKPLLQGQLQGRTEVKSN